MKDFSFQGKAFIGMRNPDGTPGVLYWTGDASQLQLKLTTSTDERQESFSGNRLESVRLVTAKKAEFTLVLNEFSAKNLGLALYGNAINVVTGTVTAEALPNPVAKGDIIALANRDVSTLVLTDSTPTTPKTLVAGTDYQIDSAAGGIIEFIGDLSSFMQPITAAYSYAAAVQLPMFTQGVPERYILFDGINSVDNSTVKVRLYRAVFDPASQLDLIDSKLSTLSISGSVLYDQTNAANANLGGFGRIEMAGVTP